MRTSFKGRIVIISFKGTHGIPLVRSPKGHGLKLYFKVDLVRFKEDCRLHTDFSLSGCIISNLMVELVFIAFKNNCVRQLSFQLKGQ